MKFNFKKKRHGALSSEVRKIGKVDFGMIDVPKTSSIKDSSSKNMRYQIMSGDDSISFSCDIQGDVKKKRESRTESNEEDDRTPNFRYDRQHVSNENNIERVINTSSSAEEDDVFQYIDRNDSLDDFMNRSRDEVEKFHDGVNTSSHIEEKKYSHPILNRENMRSMMQSMSSESTTTSADLPIDIDPIYSKKKGIIILDPDNNGELYRMSENNKNLMNKDLIIIKGKKSEDSENDAKTQVSNITEVTYEKSKEEKVAIIMQQIEKITGDNFCSNFNCYANDDASENDSGMKLAPKSFENSSANNIKQEFSAPLLFFKTLMSNVTGGSKVLEVGCFQEQIIVCITRVYLSQSSHISDTGLKCTFNQPNLSHDLGVKLVERTDGRAMVVEVLKDSTAMRSGVRIGDIMSFAVPLNNTFHGYEKACDFISRLELIGMRSSYREIFDMFLSKTTSGYPVAIVFRRKSEAVKRFESLPLGMLSVDMNIDLSRASIFFHEIVTRSRDFDFNNEANGLHETIRGNIEQFMMKPHARHKSTDSFSLSNERVLLQRTAESSGIETGIIFVPKSQRYNDVSPEFMCDKRRSSLLTWYAEKSDAILYLKISGLFGGSGVLLGRSKDGQWSAPCSVGGTIEGSTFNAESPVEIIIFIRDLADINDLRQGERIDLGGEASSNRVFAVSKINDTLIVDHNVVYKIYPRCELNKSFYPTIRGRSGEDMILSFKVPVPDESVGFYGAVRKLESPSTMYPHPIPPVNLLKFNSSSWIDQESCKLSEPLDAPCDEESISTLRDLLLVFSENKSTYLEEVKEFGIFLNKFRQMLFDGITIDSFWRNNEVVKKNNDQQSKALLKLRLSKGSGNKFRDELVFAVRSGNDRKDDSVVDFRFPLDEIPVNSSSLIIRVDEIRSIYQKPSNGASSSVVLKEKKNKKRYVSIEAEGKSRITFMARTGKDAALLACGLKLIAEMVQIKDKKLW